MRIWSIENTVRKPIWTWYIFQKRQKKKYVAKPFLRLRINEKEVKTTGEKLLAEQNIQTFNRRQRPLRTPFIDCKSWRVQIYVWIFRVAKGSCNRRRCRLRRLWTIWITLAQPNAFNFGPLCWLLSIRDRKNVIVNKALLKACTNMFDLFVRWFVRSFVCIGSFVRIIKVLTQLSWHLFFYNDRFLMCHLILMKWIPKQMCIAMMFMLSNPHTNQEK